MLGLHIKKCAEQADNREVENRGGNSLFSLFSVLFLKPNVFDG